MGKYFDMLMEDVRMKEGLHSCMNCGVCTGVCPAAEFYNYDPRQIVSIVQTRDDEAIERLLKSDTIWYCGECMSCRPRCPRGNTPGYVIQALRTLSQKLGFFVESEKGRQQLALKRIIGENILRTGYCIVPRLVKPDLHPEQGTVWKWIYDNDREIYGQFTPVYMRHGAPSGRGVARRDQRDIQGQRRQRDVRHHRAAFRPQGPRNGLRGGRRPAVHDGCLPFEQQRTLLTMTMKRKSWQDYQKEIADDHY